MSRNPVQMLWNAVHWAFTSYRLRLGSTYCIHNTASLEMLSDLCLAVGE
jgi:hypothetical protein